MFIIKIGTLLILLLLAALEDLRFYKVNNKIIIMGLLLGFIVNVYESGVDGLVIWFLGALTPLVLLFLLYLCRMMGAGDLKVFSFIGCFLGVSFVLRSIVVSFILGAILSFFILLKNRSIFSRCYRVISYVSESIQSRRLMSYYTLSQDDRKYVIPFTVAIFGSVVLCLLQDIYHIKISL